VDSHKGMPFLAFIDIAAHLWGQIAPSSNFKGMNRRFQPNLTNIKMLIL